MKARIREEILTIPNILSMMRIAMIAAVVVLFVMKYYLAAGIVLICSGVTDILDGFIARTFNMTSALGKALDPFADKLTQFAVLICLSLLNPLILIPFVILLPSPSKPPQQTLRFAPSLHLGSISYPCASKKLRT